MEAGNISTCALFGWSTVFQLANLDASLEQVDAD